jgi:hypothetical protein
MKGLQESVKGLEWRGCPTKDHNGGIVKIMS